MAVESAETSSFLVDHLPRIEWLPHAPLFQYKGFWLLRETIEHLAFIETQYNPLPTDVLIASFPKSGTTWLKAITFAILHNHIPNDPLQTQNPHQLIPFLENQFSDNTFNIKTDEIHSPRIFSTHIPYSILPKNVKESTSGSKIIYISRNPADIIVSAWSFHNKVFGVQRTLQDHFDEYINGIVHGGPLFDHVIEYWEERARENILFITYEGLKEYPNENVKRIAKFLGCSLSNDEVEEVVRKTSFERLSKLEINTNQEKGFFNEELTLPFSSFFRKGNVGDGKKCLTPEMLEKLNAIIHQKWGDSGLLSKLRVVEPHQAGIRNGEVKEAQTTLSFINNNNNKHTGEE